MTDLPSYDDLPVTGGPAGSSWGLWGDDDVFGALNLLTADRVRRGAALVRRGTVFSLNLDLEQPSPPVFAGRRTPTHTVSWLGGQVGHDDELSDWNTQASSQWDGFRHIRSLQHGFYTGVDDERHGVHHWARRGIVGRGVLADVARHRQLEGTPLAPDQREEIDAALLEATLDRQGVALETGDLLLVRTGWLTWYRGLDQPARDRLPGALTTPGLAAGEPTARFLWDHHVAGVAADNPALEAWPPAVFTDPQAVQDPDEPARAAAAFLHFSLLPLLGIPIGELWDLDALAADCADDGVYDFLLTSAPLNLHQGVASPPNALAVK